MNYLQLCQRAMLECGVSGTLSTVANQVGSLNRVVTWVNQGWLDLQAEHDDWDWMRSSNLLGAGVSFATVAGTYTYPLGTGAGTCGVTAATFGKWDREAFRCQVTTVGTSSETHLDEISYDTWRDAYMFSAMRDVQTRPVAIAVGPNKSLCLGPPPNDLYTVTGDYFIAPTSMTLDADTPTGLPERFHMLAVYEMMLSYAAYESAPEVMSRAIRMKRKLRAQLDALYAPRIGFGGAL